MTPYEPYEAITAAIAMIDGAIGLLDDMAFQEVADLNDIRNDLNRRRVALLGNGAARPFDVADLRLVETDDVEDIIQ